MKSAILFITLALQYVFNINVVAAQRGKTVKSHEIHNDLMDRFNAQKGKRGGKIREKMANRNPVDAVDSFERRQSMLGGLHQEVSRKLAASHEGRGLLNEETLKRMNRRKKALAKRRESAGKETSNESFLVAGEESWKREI